MTRAILWKEMREQGNIAIMLVVFGALVVAAIPLFPPSHDQGELALGVMGLFAWIFGLVAGAQLLAGEEENGTQAWLDMQPTSRRRLWGQKAFAGAAVVFAQTVLLWAIVFAMTQAHTRGKAGVITRDEMLIIALVLMADVAVCGYAGGLLGSGLARTSLGAVGWGIIAQFAIVAAAIVFSVSLELGAPGGGFICVALSLAALAPAATRYTNLDRLREQSTRVLTAAGPASRRVLLWLAWRQGRRVWWALLLIGLALACIVPVPSSLLWPLAGALFGVLAGLMAFGPDHGGGAQRFFGDRRLPPGAIWRGKLASPLVIVGVTIGLLTANLLARYWVDANNSPPASDPLHRDLVWLRSGLSAATLILGPLYGFACGQFFGLVYRKTVVAAVLAVVTSLGAVLLWLPSITLGGLHVWQWLAPPFVLLIATRVGMRAWVAGRLGSVRSVAGLAAACLIAVGGVAGGIAYRTFELPAPAGRLDHPTRVGRLEAEKYEAGRLVRQALEQFGQHYSKVDARFAPPIGVEGGMPGGAPMGMPGPQGPPAAPGSTPPVGEMGGPPEGGPQRAGLPQGPPEDLLTRATRTLTHGWPTRDDQLNRWLDDLFQGEWVATLRAAVGKPAGVPINSANGESGLVNTASLAGALLAARSLQLQHRGDFESALDPLESALTLSANLQSFPTGYQLAAALNIERQALGTLGEWTGGVGARPELLRRALAAVRANDRGPSPMQSVADIEFDRTPWTMPPPWQYDGGRNDFERSLVPFAGAVVWEADRYGRFVKAVREGYVRYAGLDFRTAAAAFGNSSRQTDVTAGQGIFSRWIGPTGLVASRDETGRLLIEFVNRSPWLKDAPMVFVPELSQWYNVQTQLQGSSIRLGLMLYQCDHGRLPDSLEELVPTYLPSLPADPYSGGPFHYRISPGERIRMLPFGEEPNAFRDLVAGAAVAWSVGPNLANDGGRTQEPNAGYSGIADGDVLFIVPRISKP
ncbi:MAG TPA: hypothetical protein VL371_25225 [Gemmataceae bacterium]|nr:hypothetical protein [Gemmataceae bacterium]